MEYTKKQLKLIDKLYKAALLLSDLSTRLSTKEDPFRAIIFVEGVGLFLSRDWAYGVVDLDMEALEKRFPGKVVYKIGTAERIE